MTETPPIRALLEQASQELGTESTRLDAEVLLAACLGKPRSYLHTWPERSIDQRKLECFEQLIRRRARGEPVAHLTGQREFWSLPLVVTPATLIPRPETETLVELALDKLPPDTPLRIADLGTGSGAIALAIATERPRCEIIATDISERALAVARCNAEQLGLDNIRFIAGDWCESLPAGRFDAILSNPPYVAERDPHLDSGDVRFEPRQALVAGPEGMDALRLIACCANDHLRQDGWLIVEHGCDQGEKVMQLLQAEGYNNVSTRSDGAGLSRVTLGRCGRRT
ncbi:MAG: peptide chain release factor N(5)-glutamine methyltransferase [Gammaproteobacteria bacterium]|nr:peptide chain release factor N(5)-glutamine methyltransferase [Gammaproteobacteria bacterium]